MNTTDEYLRLRPQIELELSNKQSILCICGKLASGFHESNCRRFQKKVTDETNRRVALNKSRRGKE